MRQEKIAPSVGEKAELQSALEEHFSKQKLKNVGDYLLPSIKAFWLEKEFVKTPFS